MRNFDEHTDLGVEKDENSEDLPPPPLVAFARRNRLPLGLTAAGIMGAFFVWAVVGMAPATVPGVFGLVQRYSFPLMCLLIALVALTWAFRLRTLWTNLAAYAAIGTYVVYLVVGWVYEHFIAG